MSADAPPTVSISTPIPDNVSAEVMLKTLHNHDSYIRTTCPQLVTYQLVEGDPSSSIMGGAPAVYSITDKKPIGQTTYTLAITNRPDGVDTLVNAKAPVGALVIRGKWRVVEGMLVETVVIEGNMVVKKMVKGNVEKDHPAQHEELIKLAAAA
jgi:hypothetical protein